MPPARHSRLSSGPAAKGSQKTLSFSNSKVTKPSTPIGKSALSSSTIIKDDVSPLVKPEANEELGHVTSDAVVQQQARIELAKPKTVEELKAEKVTDAQIRKYWKDREAERRTKRVHQEDLSVEERVLRLFDTSSQFGPCIGIARMKRWVRANKLGLNPPIEVLAVLLKEEEAGNEKIERAYVDELMSSKFVVGDA